MTPSERDRRVWGARQKKVRNAIMTLAAGMGSFEAWSIEQDRKARKRKKPQPKEARRKK